MMNIDSWLPADGLKLEPNALRAAKELKVSLALTAGPGAGKTEMLAQRADFLLRTGTSPYPKRILAISFKVDASKNLKDRVVKRCGFEMASRFDSYTFHAFAKRIIDKFRVILKNENALDADYTIGEKRVHKKVITFKDLVPLAIEILESSHIARNAITQTYSDVFLDEFQDCTDIQYKLLKIAFLNSNARLTAVGDTKQKIMGWAGALEGIFLEFAKDFKAAPLNMYSNFRSKPQLLRMQNDIIKVLDMASAMGDEEIKGDEGEIFSFEFDDQESEAVFLAEMIESWVVNEKIPLSEIAILTSKLPDLFTYSLMRELDKRDIPFRNENNFQDILSEPVSRLLTDYLLCLYGKSQPKSWVRLTTMLSPFVDDHSQNAKWLSIQDFIKDRKNKIANSSKGISDYSEWWAHTIDFLKIIGQSTLTSLSDDYQSIERLKSILDEINEHISALLLKDQDLLKALNKLTDEQAIRILTIHKSKGLEFHSVIITPVDNEIFFGKEIDERCAFFVGVSRAKERLLLSYAKYRERPENYEKYWISDRTPQEEYFGYSYPYLK